MDWVTALGVSKKSYLFSPFGVLDIQWKVRKVTDHSRVKCLKCTLNSDADTAKKSVYKTLVMAVEEDDFG